MPGVRCVLELGIGLVPAYDGSVIDVEAAVQLYDGSKVVYKPA